MNSKTHDDECYKFLRCWQCSKLICGECAIRSGGHAVLCDKCANLTNEETEAGWGDLHPEIIEGLRRTRGPQN